MWHLRGEAEARQVEGARLALQHNRGLGGAAKDGVTVKQVYEAARTNKDGSFVTREVTKKKQYDGLGIKNHFEPVQEK